jgi:hypothetical protein
MVVGNEYGQVNIMKLISSYVDDEPTALKPSVSSHSSGFKDFAANVIKVAKARVT